MSCQSHWRAPTVAIAPSPVCLSENLSPLKKTFRPKEGCRSPDKKVLTTDSHATQNPWNSLSNKLAEGPILTARTAKQRRIESKRALFKKNRLQTNRDLGLGIISTDIGANQGTQAMTEAQRKVFQDQLKDAQTQLIKRLIEREMLKQNKCNELLVISTANTLYQSWKLLVIFLSFISSFQYAYYAAMLDSMEEDDRATFFVLDTCYQALFLADILVNFFVEHHYPSSTIIERDLRKLFMIYVKGRFALDILAIFPSAQIYQDTFHLAPGASLLYLLKLIRLKLVFELLNYKIFMKQIKVLFDKRIQKIITSESPLAEDQIQDNTKITSIVLISYLLKATQLILILLSISFLTGLIWYVFANFQEYYSIADSNFSSDNTPTFITANNFPSKTNLEKMVTLTYFAFTTLSTVGLGDLHPTSSSERIFGAFTMLFGVAITSFVMENFIVMLNQIRTFNKGFEEASRLSQFFKTIERFNEDRPLRTALQQQISDYFAHRWSHNHNLAICTRQDEDLLEQLPKSVQNQIYSDFLFRRFLQIYNNFFKGLSGETFFVTIQLPTNTQALSRSQKDEDDNFRDFLTSILRNLEPRQLESNSLILRPNQEVDEVLFIMNCPLKVGYNHEFFMLKTVNHQIQKVTFKQFKKQMTMKLKDDNSLRQNLQRQISRSGTFYASKYNLKKFYYPLTFQPGQNIGFFEITCKQKCGFLFRTAPLEGKKVDCLFIRKLNWHKIIEESKNLAQTIQKFEDRVLIDYLNRIYFPIQDFQDKIILNGEERKMIETETRIAKLNNQLQNERRFKNPLKRKERHNHISSLSSPNSKDSFESRSYSFESEGAKSCRSRVSKFIPASAVGAENDSERKPLVGGLDIIRHEKPVRRIRFKKIKQKKKKNRRLSNNFSSQSLQGSSSSSSSSNSSRSSSSSKSDKPKTPQVSHRPLDMRAARRRSRMAGDFTSNRRGRSSLLVTKHGITEEKTTRFSLLMNAIGRKKKSPEQIQEEKQAMLKKFRVNFKKKMMIHMFKQKLRERILEKLENSMAKQVRNIWNRKVNDDNIRLLIKEKLSFMKLKNLLVNEGNDEKATQQEKQLHKKEEKQRRKLQQGRSFSSSSSDSESSSDDESELSDLGNDDDQVKFVKFVQKIEDRLAQTEEIIVNIIEDNEELRDRLVDSEYQVKKLMEIIRKGGNTADISDPKTLAQFALSEESKSPEQARSPKSISEPGESGEESIFASEGRAGTKDEHLLSPSGLGSLARGTEPYNDSADGGPTSFNSFENLTAQQDALFRLARETSSKVSGTSLMNFRLNSRDKLPKRAEQRETSCFNIELHQALVLPKDGIEEEKRPDLVSKDEFDNMVITPVKADSQTNMGDGSFSQCFNKLVIKEEAQRKPGAAGNGVEELKEGATTTPEPTRKLPTKVSPPQANRSPKNRKSPRKLESSPYRSGYSPPLSQFREVSVELNEALSSSNGNIEIRSNSDNDNSSTPSQSLQDHSQKSDVDRKNIRFNLKQPDSESNMTSQYNPSILHYGATPQSSLSNLVSPRIKNKRASKADERISPLNLVEDSRSLMSKTSKQEKQSENSFYKPAFGDNFKKLRTKKWMATKQSGSALSILKRDSTSLKQSDEAYTPRIKKIGPKLLKLHAEKSYSNKGSQSVLSPFSPMRSISKDQGGSKHWDGSPDYMNKDIGREEAFRARIENSFRSTEKRGGEVSAELASPQSPLKIVSKFPSAMQIISQEKPKLSMKQKSQVQLPLAVVQSQSNLKNPRITRGSRGSGTPSPSLSINRGKASLQKGSTREEIFESIHEENTQSPNVIANKPTSNKSDQSIKEDIIAM